MDKLKTAPLTSSLLATKGAATPALLEASRGALVYLPRPEPRLVAAQNGRARSRGKRVNGSAAGGKATVTMSFRLDLDRHLRLKLLAAHSHGSMRECLEKAVDLYLAKSGPGVRGGGCPCVVESDKPEKT